MGRYGRFVALLVFIGSTIALNPSLPHGRLHAQAGMDVGAPQVSQAVGFAVSGPVRDLPNVAPTQTTSEIDGEDEPLREVRNRQLPLGAADDEQRIDGAVQPNVPVITTSTPAPSLSFDAL